MAFERIAFIWLCESYNETSQYKYNYIRNKFHVEIESNQMETILEVETPPPNVQYSGVQYVGDNIDLNIVSTSGNTAFHAMGVVKVNSKSSSMTDEYLNSKLSRLRLKVSDRAKILRAGDILIKLCSDPKKSGMTPLSSNH